MKSPLFALAALLVSGAATAQTPAEPAPDSPPMFPFVMPWDDAVPGTITDVSYLNAMPAGKNGYIVPRNGHFVESKTGKRVRFLATNFAAAQAFPDHADAEKEARHLAKQGYNLVRLHHMDNTWGNSDGSLWDPKYKDHQHINPAQLDRVDYLFAQLKKNGVYSNINLHVSRKFTAADGFPASVEKVPFDFDKRVDEFDRRMIQLQKNYARDLLTHVNPYTQLPYTQDPAVAVVEINNENSLVGDGWNGTYGGDLIALPEPFLGELAGFWNDWLTKKYGTDAKVQAAWTAGLTATGPGMLANTSVWSIEHQGTSQADFATALDRRLSLGAPNIDVHIVKTDGTGWHVQVHQTGLDLHSGDTYSVSFRAKSDTPRSINLSAGLDQNDWHTLGLSKNFDLTADWKEYHAVFTAQNAVPSHSRLAFTLGDSIGTVSIQDLQIHPGAEGAGLQPGQSLTQKTVPIPDTALKAPHEDWVSFLADTERSYVEEMRAYLKNDLHVKANIIGSQISWGGLTGMNRETKMDFADNHAYWQHPSFPHKPWDSVDWNITNTAMVSDLASGGGTLQSLAQYRVAGKPYSISEYNHPAPSDYRAEMMPEYASFAAFQDWDIIYLFAQGDYGANASTDKINGFFDLANDPSRTVFLPAAALIFRAGEMAPASNAAEAAFPKDQLVPLASASGVWSAATGKGDVKLSPFAQRLSLRLGDKHIQDVSLRQWQLRSAGDASILNVSKTSFGALYTAIAPAAVAAAGYVGGQTVTLGGSALTFPAFGNNFAALTLTATDQKPIAQSHRLLLTLVGKVENQGMVWNADRTSLGNHWGHGPIVAEGIPATVTLKSDAVRHVWALDGTGRRRESVPAAFTNGSLTFKVGPQFQTLWYEIGE